MGALLFPGASALKNSDLFKGPLKSVGTILINDIESMPQASLDAEARATFKDGAGKDRRFSSYLLNYPDSGFVLTGIVNRMDRAYRVVDAVKKTRTCGEIRFLYRFTYDYKELPGIEHSDPIVKFDGHNIQDAAHLDSLISADSAVDRDVEVVILRNGAEVPKMVRPRRITSRLPLTATVVLNAKNPADKITCGEIARRWLAAEGRPDLLAYLRSEQGPLNYLKPSQVDRLEANFQLFRIPASGKPDFGGYAEYLLRIFRRERPGAPFIPFPMENQIDRDRLMSNPRLLASFKRWLFNSPSIWDLDHGVLDIPHRYLAIRAISASPGGSSRSQNEPFSSLISEEEIRQALERYEAQGSRLRMIKTPEGFSKRLNDLTCTGCHQTRAIAGFHFTGADPVSEPRNNAVHVPGSPFFFGDLPRRRAVVEAFAAGKKPDFSHGFTDRPDKPFRAALAGTQLFDGWGVACHQGGDASFAKWTCAPGLECKVVHQSPRHPRMGTCVSIGKIGDPVEFGRVEHQAFGNDRYLRTDPPGSTDPDNYDVPKPPNDRTDYMVAHQGYRAVDQTGGFPGGMLRIKGVQQEPPKCPDNLPAEATCGRVAATGFNNCLAQRKPFTECLKLTETAGLRACDRANPCRDDYICTAPYDDLTPGQKLGADGQKMGTCIPPYFMFQFRVDGHPSSYSIDKTLASPVARDPGGIAASASARDR